MSTEYRRGIPSTAYVEAATRLGLEWEEVRPRRSPRRWRFQIRDGELWCDFWSDVTGWDRDLQPLSSGRIADRTDVEHRTFRPIRPDGTPVDWEVLDQEVARVGQQGSPTTVTPTAPTTQPLSQPEGFRADLFRRIASHFDLVIRDVVGDFVARIISVRGLVDVNAVGIHANDYQWGWGTTSTPVPGPVRADIIARWTVYQELKPLYDLVDGAQGEAAMPRDVEAEWARQIGYDVSMEQWLLRRTDALEAYTSLTGGRYYSRPLGNFAAVLDAVAERRVAERMRGQTQAPTITSGLPPAPIGTVMVQDVDGTVRPARMNDTARVIGLAGIDMPAAVRPTAQPEPRRFADVRPDRHGWRWWRVQGPGIANTTQIECSNHLGEVERQFRFRGSGFEPWTTFILDRWLDRTVIPTDEQGNPVSWESIGPTDPTESGRVYDVEWVPTNATTGTLRDVHTARIRRLDRFVAEAIRAGNTGSFSTESRIWPQGRAVSAVSEPRPGQFSNNPTTPPLTPEGLLSAMQNYTVGTGAKPAQAPPITTWPPPLPRFTADELDDVDHSKTTKLDEVTLRRGKLPTVEQIAKYREVRARRTGGSVAEALKESRIDCEVAQYVLERWTGGLDDAAAHELIAWVVETTDVGLGLFVCSADARAQQWIDHHSTALDTSEKPSPTVQRERQEAEERRQRLAELRQRLAAERAAQPQEMAKEGEVSRFDLIEPDPQADPAASIRAWEASQAAAKARPVPASPHIAKPVAAPRRPAIDVVDAEVDGLSRSEAFTALFGRALNGGC